MQDGSAAHRLDYIGISHAGNIAHIVDLLKTNSCRANAAMPRDNVGSTFWRGGRAMAADSGDTPGGRLRLFRRAFGYSQVQLADVLGKSNRAISNYENGERDIGRTELKIMKEKFGITADWILFGDPNGLSLDFLKRLNSPDSD